MLYSLCSTIKPKSVMFTSANHLEVMIFHPKLKSTMLVLLHLRFEGTHLRIDCIFITSILSFLGILFQEPSKPQFLGFH